MVFGKAGGVFDLPGIRLAFSGNVANEAKRELVYGAGTLNDLLYYNLTYILPVDLKGVPELVISFEKL
jgi:hypothetical protein